MARLLYLMTDPLACRFLRGQCADMKRRGLEVCVTASPGEDLDALGRSDLVDVESLAIPREITPWRDFVALVRLWRLMRRRRPDIVNAGTAKASLLGMIAAWLAGVPVRIYTVHGLRLETTRGLKRRILKTTEHIASRLAHRIICVSESLRQTYIGLDPSVKRKSTVLGGGSCNGVDIDRFRVTPERLRQAELLRGELGIPGDAPVIGFVGRLVRDKGIVELVEAFDNVRQSFPEVRLLLVGDFEAGDPLPDGCAARLRDDDQIISTGFVNDPAPYYPIMNLVALPTYREGFPVVPLEAASAERPVVAFRATGTVDAVEDGVTGKLVAARDASALAEAFKIYLIDPELARTHGAAGLNRVVNHFRPEVIWDALFEEYSRLLNERTSVSVQAATVETNNDVVT